jgi:uncharacterized membrane protein
MAQPVKIPEGKMGLVISWVLRIGVITAAALTLSGGVLYLLHSGGSVVSYGVSHRGPTILRNFTDLLRAGFGGGSGAIMQLGLIVLIATPVARVLFSVFAFLLDRDYLYVVITIIVLLILLTSILIL